MIFLNYELNFNCKTVKTPIGIPGHLCVGELTFFARKNIIIAQKIQYKRSKISQALPKFAQKNLKPCPNFPKFPNTGGAAAPPPRKPMLAEVVSKGARSRFRRAGQWHS